MSRIATILLLTASLVCLSACSSSKQQPYISDAPRDVAEAITNRHTTTIYPGDQLYIHIYSQHADAAIPYNEETNNGIGDARITGYLVSDEGDILFPSIGKVNTTGLTVEELGHRIEGLLVEGGFLMDPIATVSLMNFRVTVIGEVKMPRQLHVDGNRLTIFEAIAQCGDITRDGVKSCVTIIRSTGDRQVVDTIDLTSRQILTSPYYYLQQNDIVYVEPTAKKKRIAYRDDDWPQYLSTGVSAVRMAYLLIYRTTRAYGEATR